MHFEANKIRAFELTFILSLKLRGIQEKSIRQNWVYSELQEGRGNPTRIFFLDSLPDEIQVAWAKWDEEKYLLALKSEKRKDSKGRPDRVPEPVELEHAKEVLGWPERTSYYMQPPESGETKDKAKRGRLGRVYDGASYGLCPAAKRILLDRFPSLSTAVSEPLDGFSEKLVAYRRTERKSDEKEGSLPRKAVHREGSAPVQSDFGARKQKRMYDLYEKLIEEKEHINRLLEIEIGRLKEQMEELKKENDRVKKKLRQLDIPKHGR